ncbi:MAG: hypothetical protein ACD_38C00069G0018 [uncultured bacterium]|nr:MAG: hypothetical protein ACD_38C00069G0018 [uncultured bacterium]
MFKKTSQDERLKVCLRSFDKLRTQATSSSLGSGTLGFKVAGSPPGAALLMYSLVNHNLPTLASPQKRLMTTAIPFL